MTATDYYTTAPRRAWSSTPVHIYQILLHIIFFVLLRTHHVASVAHMKSLTRTAAAADSAATAAPVCFAAALLRVLLPTATAAVAAAAVCCHGLWKIGLPRQIIQ